MKTDLETVTIRKMMPEDVDGVIAIEAKAYGDHHWSKQSFLDEVNNNLARYYVLLNDNNEVCAYAGCWHILEETHITNVAVDMDHRRKNYAKALLKQLIGDCYKDMIKFITLEVRVSNTPAISLYEKFGFKSFGTRKKYYQDNNEDALIMWTKNIFHSEFKTNYEKIVKELEEKIIIK